MQFINQKFSYNKRKESFTKHFFMYLKKSNSGSGISHRDVVTVSVNVAKCARRDLIFLGEMGVTVERLTKWEADIEALNSIPSYKDTTAKKAIVTKKRNLSEDELVVSVKRLRSQLYFIFSKEAGDYQTLFSKSLNKLSLNELINTGFDMLEAFKVVPEEELSLCGVTPERIAKFETEVKALQLNSEDQQLKTGLINNKTDERADLKSDVFNTLQFVCRIGKAYWTTKNPGLYSDYVISKQKSLSSGTATIPEDLSTASEDANTEVF